MPCGKWLFAAVVLFLAGCASVNHQAAFTDVNNSVRQRTGVAVHWNLGTSEDQAVADHVTEWLAQDLTADDAVRIALLNNPGLQATYEDLGVAQSAVVQAGLLKNPRFTASFLPVASGGAGAVPTIGLELAQDFLHIFGMALRQRSAAAQFEAAQARVTGAVLELAGQTRKAFYDYQAAQQMVELRQTTTGATAAAIDAAQKLFDAGNITKLSLDQEKALDGESQLDLSAAQGEFSQARERVNRLMGLWGPTSGTWKAAGRLADIPKDEIDTADIELRALSQSLELAAARHDLEASTAQAGLSKQQALFPELELGIAGEREDDGSWHVGPTLSVPLPIFDQGQAANTAAAGEVRRAYQLSLQLTVVIRSSARAAKNHLIIARQRALFQRDAMLPLKREMTQETHRQYDAMQVGLFQLLQARRDEIEAGRQYIQLLRDYWMARADVESLLAGRLANDESSGSDR